MKNTLLLWGVLTFLTFKNHAQSTVQDIDGNIYNTVTIGTQVWMKENLKTTHYQNGNPITKIIDNNSWGNQTAGARCYYNNDSTVNTPVYGSLYNWYAATDIRNVCPTGWHVPNNSEWNIMETYLDNTTDTINLGLVGTDIGGSLKETDTTHWASPNTGADNSSGFLALPGGYRSNDGSYDGVSSHGFWWTTNAYNTTYSWYRHLTEVSSKIDVYYTFKVDGFSVRCLKDPITTAINEKSIDNQIHIYPNPAIDRLYVDCFDRKNLKIQVYNIIGDCVIHSILTNGTNEIDISSLTTGIYIIRLTGADGTIQQKLIKN